MDQRFCGKRQHDDQGSDVQESWANQGRVSNPVPGDDNATWRRRRQALWRRGPAGTNAGRDGGTFHLLAYRTTYARVSREFDHLGTGTLQATRESIQPQAMWAPALVPQPLIGRHRSQCSWDVPVTPPKRRVVQRMQRIYEWRSTHTIRALAGSTTVFAFHPHNL